MDIGKVPPHDIEAEQAVIGSMLTDKEAVSSSIEVLKEEDFYREDNRIIYSAMLNLYNRAEPIDLKETIKTLGMFTIEIKLYEGVVGKLKIDVISKA